MPILAIPKSGWFIEERHALIYDRWPIADEVKGAWKVGLTVGPDVLQAVTGEDIIAAAKHVFDRRKSVTGHIKSASAREVTQ